jgi:hypothetical protein
MDELYDMMIPIFKQDYKEVIHKTGMTYEEYLRLKKCELEMTELKFPGLCKSYVKRVNKVKWFGKITCIVVMVFVSLHSA